MSQELQTYETIHVPTYLIWSDDEFNCRGVIAPMEVHDLCQDIEKNGLQFPIAIQPMADVNHREDAPEGTTYRIIAGHRRFKAWQVLQATHREKGDNNPFLKIPCMVKNGLTDIAARVLNLGENLKRKDLNILQEARAIEKLQRAGVPRDHVAQELGKSSGWVQARYNLLSLPEDVQEEAAAGILTQHQIKQLYSHKDNREALYEAVRKIKEAKARGEKGTFVGKRQQQSTDVKKARKPPEIQKMIELVGNSPVGMGLTTRALAWSAGNIATEEFFNDIRRYCEKYDLETPVLPREF